MLKRELKLVFKYHYSISRSLWIIPLIENLGKLIHGDYILKTTIFGYDNAIL